MWLQEGNYVLEEEVGAALARLPFPDPRLTLGEAQELAKGRGRAQQKIKKQLGKIIRK